ncbi:MAG: hypothetical protein GF364_17410 [Candidatus Lokiarchaeota archaeon]|nr:hypothetical protein [Candidatus Lokiarchaeota archaeon]
MKTQTKNYLVFFFLLISFNFLAFHIHHANHNTADSFNAKESIKLFQSPLVANEPSEDSINVYYFYNNGCDICINKRMIVRQFNQTHDDLNYYEKEIYCGNAEDESFAENFFSTYPKDIVGIPNPVVVFTIGSDCFYIISSSNDITMEVLENVYSQLIENPQNCVGWVEYGEFNLLLAFVTGILSGLSPCVILMTGVLGASYFSTQSKKSFFLGMIGFIIGILTAYFCIGLAFTYLIDFANAFFGSILIKLVIGIPLIILGVWYIADAWNESSKLFKTPYKVKQILKKMTNQNSIISTFLLGLAFTLIKSPCVAAILLSLLFNINSYASTMGNVILNLSMFAIGVILPILLIFMFIRLGINSEKVNNKRKEYRPYLRMISGILIIALTIWSFF